MSRHRLELAAADGHLESDLPVCAIGLLAEDLLHQGDELRAERRPTLVFDENHAL